MRYSIILLVIYLFLPSLFGQETRYILEHFSKEDGLTDGGVHQIIQDKDGFMWFGTLDGLVRYDGYNFKYYQHDILNETSLPDNAVLYLMEDANDNLVVGGWYSLSLYKRGCDCFDRILVKEDVFPWAPFIDKKNRIWFSNKQSDATTNEIRLYDINGEQFITPKIDSIYQLDLLFSDAEKNIWGYGKGRVHQINYSSDSLIINAASVQNVTNSDLDIPKKGFRDSQNKFWIFDDKGSLFWGEFDKPFSNFDKIPNIYIPNEPTFSFSHIMEDRKGYIWIASEWEIFKIDRSDYSYQKFYHDPCNIKTLSNQAVLQTYEDNGGVIWIASEYSLSKITQKESFFKQMIPLSKKSSEDKLNTVFTIKNSKNNYWWVGIPYFGLLKKSYKNELIDSYVRNPNKLNQIASSTVISLMEEQNNLWIGTYFGGLSKLNTITGKFTNYRGMLTQDSTILKDEVIRGFAVDKKNNIWFPRLGGVSMYNYEEEYFINYDLPVVQTLHFFQVVIDEQDNKWIGGGGKRLFKLDANNELSDFEIPTLHHILCMHIDSISNNLWIGTQGNGIMEFDLKKELFVNYYDSKEDLNGSIVYGMLFDNGNLWLSTNKGISKFNLDERLFTNYGIEDGLPTVDYNSGAFARDNSGNLYFGGKSITYFNPLEIEKNEHLFSPQVRFTNLNVLGKPKEFELPIHKLKEITLNPNETFWEIEFASLDYNYPRNIQYQYKLEGFDKNWTMTKDNFANYANLLPGIYQFLLKASNSNGIWNKEIQSITIQVLPSFWQKTWVRAVGVFGILGLVFGGIYGYFYRRNKKQRKLLEKKEKQLNETYQKALLESLKKQMEPHFLFNTLHTGSKFISRGDIREASNYLAKLSMLLRKILNQHTAVFIPLKEEIEMLKLYINLEEEKYEGVFESKVNIAPNIDVEHIFIPPMLLQPYVENSIIHGLSKKQNNTGQLLINITRKENRLICLIEDNGVGRSYSKKIKEGEYKQRKSTGMTNVSTRINLINQLYNTDISIEIEDLLVSTGNKDVGTKIHLKLPVDLKQKI